MSRLAEPCDRTVAALLSELGAVAAVERIVSGAGRLSRFAARARTLDVERDLDVADRAGARVVIPGDPEWPEQLDALEIPPWCLWVRGSADLQASLQRAVSVVGARAATSYGEHLAGELAAALGARGWTVVSGAAFGIDAAAHRGALAADAPSVAVLAGGVERPYPSAHGPLLERIARDGVVVSEVPPGSAPMKSRFLTRNRLIAAMGAATVVVEAGLRSGSLNTARHAHELCRPVGAVPGPVTSMASAGCHQAVREGLAVLVTNADEVVELVGEMGADACEPPRGPSRPGDALDPVQRRVLEALPVRRAVDLDHIAVLTTLAPLTVRSTLAQLAALDLAAMEEGRWRKRGAD